MTAMNSAAACPHLLTRTSKRKISCCDMRNQSLLHYALWWHLYDLKNHAPNVIFLVTAFLARALRGGPIQKSILLDFWRSNFLFQPCFSALSKINYEITSQLVEFLHGTITYISNGGYLLFWLLQCALSHFCSGYLVQWPLRKIQKGCFWTVDYCSKATLFGCRWIVYLG